MQPAQEDFDKSSDGKFSWWENYLSSGAKKGQVNEVSLWKIKFINAVGLVGIIVPILFGVINLINQSYLTGYLELFLAVCIVTNLVWLRVSLNEKKVARTILFIFMIMVISLFYLGGIENTGVYWLFIYPAIAFFLRGKKEGWKWVGIFLLLIAILSKASYFDWGNLSFSLIQIRQLIVSLLALSLLISVYENIGNRAKNLLSKNKLKLDKLVSFQEVILSISSRFINLENKMIADQIKLALKEVGERSGSDRSYVFLINDNKMSNVYEWVAEKIAPQINNLQDIPVDTFPVLMKQLGEQKIVEIPSVSDLPSVQKNLREHLMEQKIKSILLVPMIKKGKLMGFVGFDSIRVERSWSGETAILLKLVAGMLASVLIRKGDELILLKRKNELEKLNSLMVGRELKMIELKKELKKYSKKDKV